MAATGNYLPVFAGRSFFSVGWSFFSFSGASMMNKLTGKVLLDYIEKDFCDRRESQQGEMLILRSSLFGWGWGGCF